VIRAVRPLREAVLKRLKETLATGVANVLWVYARFLKMTRGSVTIDERAVAADARCGGKFALRTNTELPAEEVAPTYKSLWRVERVFREEKSALEVCPIFHHRDDTCIGHVVASFLAFRLEVEGHNPRWIKIFSMTSG